jgi:hypothetical protein
MKSARAGRGNPEPHRQCIWEVNDHWPDVFPTRMGDILLLQGRSFCVVIELLLSKHAHAMHGLQKWLLPLL